jgi:hypothetical protein
MERLTEWNDEQTRHAYYPRCFEEPCYGGGCKINDCPFETAVCDRLAAYEDTGLSPEKVSWMKEVVEAAFDNDTSRIERAHNLHVADKEGRVIVLPCKEGTTVYCISLPIATYPDKRKPEVVPIAFTRNDLLKFGSRVFLTREEAEKALAEMEGKKDG